MQVYQHQPAGGDQRCGRRGDLMKMLRGPSMTGKATERKTWYKASMLWSASAKTKNPDAAKSVDQLVCEQPGAAADIDKAERGIPPNTELLAGVTPNLSPAHRSSAKYITDIKSEVGCNAHRPTPRRRYAGRRLAPPTGPMSCSGGRPQLMLRRSSWTRSPRTSRSEP